MTSGSKTADKRLRVLADGNSIPVLGLGVWQIPNGPTCVNVVRWALELGYRHLDTAQAYGNEESVGRALKQSGLRREDVFITTKFYPGSEDPVAEVQGSLKRLGVDYVDLYIIHWPQGGRRRGSLQPAWDRSPSGELDDKEDGDASWANACAGAAALVFAARHGRHHEIDPSRPHRRERGRFRLHALKQRYGGTGCAR